MMNTIKTEFLKSKRITTNKFVVIAPLFSLILPAMLGGGENGAYNWWYTMFLPGMLAIISAQVITREKNLLYKGVFLYPQGKGAIWLGKIIYISILLILASLIFMIGIEGYGLIFGSNISLKANILATIILIFTLLFNIPINMFLTAQFNIFIAVIFNLGMTVVGVISYTSESNLLLTVLPYKTSSNLMASILHILPNGLPVPKNSLLLNSHMILSDTIWSVAIFIILTLLTMLWFRKKEVN